MIFECKPEQRTEAIKECQKRYDCKECDFNIKNKGGLSGFKINDRGRA